MGKLDVRNSLKLTATVGVNDSNVVGSTGNFT